MVQKRCCYLREELLALRGRLLMESLPNPVRPDCPMYTDSSVLLQETTVKKRQKDGKTTQLQKEASGSAFVAFRDGTRITEPVLQQESTLGCSANKQQPNGAEECNDTDDQWEKVMMPPRLQVPTVTIGKHRRRQAFETRENKTKTVVDVDSERHLLARLRLLQQQKQPQQNQRNGWHEEVEGAAVEALTINEVPSGGVDLIAPVKPELVTSLRHTFTDAGAPIDVSSDTSPQLGADTAVPITNVSLFKSAVGSRYFQFTRSLGLWEYLFSTLGARCPHSSCPGARVEGGGIGAEVYNRNSNYSLSGHQSSIGLDETGTTPTELDKDEAGEEKPLWISTRSDATTKTKRPHRRRTNRTHAEKREHRRYGEELLKNNCEHSVRCEVENQIQDSLILEV